MPALRQTAVAEDMDIPDDLFESLPTPGAADTPPAPARTTTLSALAAPAVVNDAVEDEMALLASLPNLPSILGLADRLATIQTQLDEARVEAEALRRELRLRADNLRALATALESI